MSTIKTYVSFKSASFIKILFLKNFFIFWIDENKKLICKTFIEEERMFYSLNYEIKKELSKKSKAKIGNLEFTAPLTEEEFSNSLYITYINFYIEDNKNISCNFDLDCEANYLFEHLANIEIDENNEILMGGIYG